MTELRISITEKIAGIAAAEWDACANPQPPDARLADRAGNGRQDMIGSAGSKSEACTYNPFIAHAFLSALEQSNSVGPRSGWQPRHVLAHTTDNALVAAVPCYLKSHSRGEYVFDHGWADAYALAGGLVEICKISGASGVHVTFAPEAEFRLLGELGYLQRTDQQFHWENSGFSSFEDFLSALTARKRKTIRRERHDALAHGINVHWLTGSDLTEAVWDAFFEFYMETGSRKWGRPYLTRQFYSLVGEAMRERIVLVMAKRAGRWIAGAINFRGSHSLFGRHWGAIEHHPFLHFELCYYQAIDYAIAHKIPRVEAGAQGEHKIARGYLPATTYSAHYIADRGLRRAIADYLVRERAYVAAAGNELATLTPFRKNLPLESD